MSTSIDRLVNDLPESSVTVYMLRSLDFAVPGQWQNFTNFDDTVREITGESEPQKVWMIRSKAIELYQDSAQGYQRAMWLYQTVDRTDAALGAMAMANKVTGRVGFLSFLNRLTPKADTAQTLDLSLKLVAELLAFCAVQGIPRNSKSIAPFVSSLGAYSQENLVRMAALVCVDGLVPLGPNFTDKALNILKNMTASDLNSNQSFQQMDDAIPGNSLSSKFGFINDNFVAVQSWIDGFMAARNLSTDKVVDNLHQYIQFTDDKLDYLGAFLDMSTSYYQHTGTQSLARHVIQRAAEEV